MSNTPASTAIGEEVAFERCHAGQYPIGGAGNTCRAQAIGLTRATKLNAFRKTVI
jgi:hypothetical protein